MVRVPGSPPELRGTPVAVLRLRHSRDAIASLVDRAKCVALQALPEAKAPRVDVPRLARAVLREAIVRLMAVVLRHRAGLVRVQALVRIAVGPSPLGRTALLPLQTIPIAVPADRGPVVPAPP